jgi:serine/threonine-protein kinase HipA
VIDFSARIPVLSVRAQGALTGELRKKSQFEFEYAAEAQAPISLILPLQDRRIIDNELFAVMDMNLPEGFLLARIRERAPKTPPTKMHLLALMGVNGIGKLEYLVPNQPAGDRQEGVSRRQLLKEGIGPNGENFAALVDSYLSTGAGLSGVQPKIIVPERATIPVPNLIVKVAGDDYPNLPANEFLCLEVARRAGLAVAHHELSDDGSLLVIERFDVDGLGRRLGFEDIAALLDLRVGAALSDRKYRGSYEDVASVLSLFCDSTELGKLFDAVALSVLVRNGDAHLKNFGVLYDDQERSLAPIYDVVTTTLYAYERTDGERVTDRTMALKLRKGEKSRLYPNLSELSRFGEEVCHVADPLKRINKIASSMEDTLRSAETDSRIEPGFFKKLRAEWEAAITAMRRRY